MSIFEGTEFDILADALGLEGDPRRGRRLASITSRLREKPQDGFPQAVDDDVELEGLYRFLNNPHLDFQSILKTHVEGSLQRCRGVDGDLLVLHDTSTFVFSGERKGLGYINKNNRGFLGHFALAVSRADGAEPLPCGIVAASTWVRSTPRKKKDVSQHELRSTPDCESHRWLETMREVESKMEDLSPIHVMDREGHIYDVLAAAVSEQFRVVVRAMGNRKVRTDDPNTSLLSHALDGLPVRFTESVPVTSRRASTMPDQRSKYPSRGGRDADVCVSATAMILKRTRNSPKEHAPETPINVVHIIEPEPPKGERAIEWILLTTEPIDSDEQVRRVVATYRQRWLIEELFKSIKTGCAFETRQLESYEGLTNALAVVLPIAWEMLLLRAESRVDDTRLAKDYISPLRMKVIRSKLKRRKRKELSENPTLKEVAYAIASFGGHLKRNGPPGWQTLQRGFEELLRYEEGWIAALETCDQS